MSVRPAKRAKLLSDDEASNVSASDSESTSDSNQGGVPLVDNASTNKSQPGSNGFKINEEFARRFEHNKKREEKQQLEEKLKNGNAKKRGRQDDDLDSAEEDEDSEDDETEDDDADLATEALDAEIFDTLRAIKSKDPRVYDKNVKFYQDYEEEEDESVEKQKVEKPMYLQDYHRRNLLAGGGALDEDEEVVPVRTYQQEQDALKKELVGSMHATADNEAEDSDDEDEGDFLVAKPKTKSKHAAEPSINGATKTAAQRKTLTNADVASADKDPETFLSNFMAARAWLPAREGDRNPYAFDSDDSDDDARAEAFEEAYNMRFEDPAKSNEKLQSFARDTAGKFGASVRREDLSGRKKAREREREKKEAEKREREEDRARLRKLRIDEAEEKVKKIREAAGLRKNEELDLAKWKDMIDGDFDDAQFDQEMEKRFGEEYYAEHDAVQDDASDAEEQSSGKRAKVKKPKWNDDIDIKDLIPEFDDTARPAVTLSSDDEAEGEDDAAAEVPKHDEDDDDDTTSNPKPTKSTKSSRAQAKADQKRIARKQRRAIEEIIDTNIPLSNPTTSSSSTSGPAPFRYRATSPTTFGLSPRDILFATDAQLNAYAGLKKMHAFRDQDKKKRDKKKFSKKQRLREWRREAFGKTEEPVGGFEGVVGMGNVSEVNGGMVEWKGTKRERKEDGGEDGEARKKRKRSKKGKRSAAVEA